ncbi:hypothetical protein Tco_0238403 [Tanacetum coccineum]
MKIVTTSRYAVPTGRVKVLAGRYVVPTGKDNVIVSTGRERPIARTLLLLSLPEDHMDEFHHLDDARDIWLAIKARFSGNEESKKMRNVAITLKAKGGLDYQNFDDLYNKLKSLEINIKGGSSYKSNHSAAPSQSDFISTTSGNNKMSYAETSKQSSSYISASPGSNVSHFNSGNVMEDVLHSFVAESDQQIIYEDFDQTRKLDLEELDIKWECTGKQVESNARYSAFKIKELEQDKLVDPKALLSVDSMVNWSDHEESADENASQYNIIFDTTPEDVDGNSNPVRFVKEGAMNAVPPPITRTFMPTSIHSDFDESQKLYGKFQYGPI